MDSIGRRLLILGVLLFANDTSLHGQEGRHGAWMEWGLGYGSSRFSCDTCTRGQRLGGWTFSFVLGGTLNPHVRLGVGLRQWLNGLKPSAPLAGISTATLCLSYFPRIRGGPFATGEVGLSHYQLGKGTGDPIEPYSMGSTYYSGTGWGLTLASGWEVPIGRTGLRPLLAYHHGTVRRLHTPDGATVATGWNQNLLIMEFQFQFNLSR